MSVQIQRRPIVSRTCTKKFPNSEENFNTLHAKPNTFVPRFSVAITMKLAGKNTGKNHSTAREIGMVFPRWLVGIPIGLAALIEGIVRGIFAYTSTKQKAASKICFRSAAYNLLVPGAVAKMYISKRP